MIAPEGTSLRTRLRRRGLGTSLSVTDKASVDLSGAAQTMLTTLYLKALDADFERPVLGDRFAKEAVAASTTTGGRPVSPAGGRPW